MPFWFLWSLVWFLYSFNSKRMSDLPQRIQIFWWFGRPKPWKATSHGGAMWAMTFDMFHETLSFLDFEISSCIKCLYMYIYIYIYVYIYIYIYVCIYIYAYTNHTLVIYVYKLNIPVANGSNGQILRSGNLWVIQDGDWDCPVKSREEK